MIDFSSYTVAELRQWIKEYQEQHGTSFVGLSKMRKAELYKLATELGHSVKNDTPVTAGDIVDLSSVVTNDEMETIIDEIRIHDEMPNMASSQEELFQIGVKSAVVRDSTLNSPNVVEIYSSFNRKQRRKFTKLCKGVIRLDDSEVTRERLASCF